MRARVRTRRCSLEGRCSRDEGQGPLGPTWAQSLRGRADTQAVTKPRGSDDALAADRLAALVHTHCVALAGFKQAPAFPEPHT